MLIACRECGEQTSTEAAACPHCGAPPKRKTGFVVPVVIAVAVIGGIWLALPTSPFPPTALNGASTVKRCTVNAISIKSIKARFVNSCRRSPCYYMQGVAVLKNGCSEPIGVQVKITGLDSTGSPVATRDTWPASIKNIPPGEYTFSLDQYLDYDSRIKSFTLQAIGVERWRDR